MNTLVLVHQKGDHNMETTIYFHKASLASEENMREFLNNIYCGEWTQADESETRKYVFRHEHPSHLMSQDDIELLIRESPVEEIRKLVIKRYEHSDVPARQVAERLQRHYQKIRDLLSEMKSEIDKIVHTISELEQESRS
jgi:HD superfamily phosphohydrolase